MEADNGGHGVLSVGSICELCGNDFGWRRTTASGEGERVALKAYIIRKRIKMNAGGPKLANLEKWGTHYPPVLKSEP